MTLFLRLSAPIDKENALQNMCSHLRQGVIPAECFEVAPEDFSAIPGSPFPYWSSETLRNSFNRLPAFESGSRCARVGLQTSDDFRFVRAFWEVASTSKSETWFPFVRGGGASKFVGVLSLCVMWKDDGAQLKAWATTVNKGQHWSRNIRSPDFYKRPGLTWPLRAAELSPYPMPRGALFSVRGAVAFEDEDRLLPLLGLMASKPFDYLFKLLLGRFGHPEFGIGALQKVPTPTEIFQRLGLLAGRAWLIKRRLKFNDETSHAFHLPTTLLGRLREHDPLSIQSELVDLQTKIDEIAFDLYDFSEADRSAVMCVSGGADETLSEDDSDILENEGEDDCSDQLDEAVGLLSWAVGVAFGRFDWRLATGERQPPAEPGPFDPLPAQSPGMVPDGTGPFFVHAGILVDDPSHTHDLTHLIESVLECVETPVTAEVRRWLQKDFFAFHLQRYSKSRRKAPIYWPLSTVSGSYTLWVYYPSLNNQTLFTAVNDFLDGPNGKLTQVSRESVELRAKGSSRSRDEEVRYEVLQGFQQELTDLRDNLLKIAPTYQPHYDDGVQITAAPLWQLFRHKPWQKVLKDTWIKLEKGDYDWAHLALAYWPERVRGKCKTDKSLAIAHGLEDLYVELEAAPKKTRGKKKTEGEE
ncbi:type II restriction endonuclease subunit M [Pseudomonas plecoglossicida]|uniref:type II restriction endonuclease subunit M n=1 Tax=Pseudomonas plecoglossicida TaxID=70775 RepID=UPI0015E32CE8|nr:type II restriction endonuclease subunit M [Pseudomonas plecoglossicida]MBA1198254.1 type II restriction endonuclease subunit M [Pseudomonas plecoglossicida]